MEPTRTTFILLNGTFEFLKFVHMLYAVIVLYSFIRRDKLSARKSSHHMQFSFHTSVKVSNSICIIHLAMGILTKEYKNNKRTMIVLIMMMDIMGIISVIAFLLWCSSYHCYYHYQHFFITVAVILMIVVLIIMVMWMIIDIWTNIFSSEIMVM